MRLRYWYQHVHPKSYLKKKVASPLERLPHPGPATSLDIVVPTFISRRGLIFFFFYSFKNKWKNLGLEK